MNSNQHFIALLLAVLMVGCNAGLDTIGGLDPDAVEITDVTDTSGEIVLDSPTDHPTDTDDDGLTDAPEVDGGCEFDAECDDAEPCNGVESCVSGVCTDGYALADGDSCYVSPVEEGLCIEGVCTSHSCGDGFARGDEECDDGNDVADDGCEDDCLTSCHAHFECDDSDVCTDDLCSDVTTGRLCLSVDNFSPCDDGDPCTTPDLCNGAGTCAGTLLICDDGRDCTVDSCSPLSGGCIFDATGCSCITDSDCDDANPCTDDDCNETAGTCTITVNTSHTCSDSNICTTGDACQSDGTCLGTMPDCSDGLDCSTDWCNPGSGACQHDVSPCECTVDSECDDVDACTDDSCHWPSGTCRYVIDATNSCNDGIGCTIDDTCDALGGCSGTPSDGLCGSGELCRPSCFGPAGCGAPPTTMKVSCPEVTLLPSWATCSIALGVTGQVPCLSCTTEVGIVTLSSDDFGSPGSCSMGDWDLISGANCRDSVDGCAEGGGAKTCCDEESTIAVTVDGDCKLRTDKDENCSGNDDSREWRMERAYDTRGLTDLEICFDVSEHDASDNEGILLFAEDAAHSEQIYCLDGLPVDGALSGPGWPYCVDLPAWAEDDPSLLLRFIMHSHDDGDILYLDNVTVRGWPASCSPSRAEAFSESFEPCPAGNPIADGWNGWSITNDGSPGSGPVCQTVCSGGSPGGAVVEDDSWTMTHQVDASGLDGDVRLCFDVGDHRANDKDESILVSFDASDGTGWQEAWSWADEFGSDDECERVCIHLSDIDIDVDRNPDLWIRFVLDSDDGGRTVFIDDIVVDGALYCDGTGHASAGGFSDLGSGAYSFYVQDETGEPMGANVTCAWDTPPVPVEGWGGTWFKDP